MNKRHLFAAIFQLVIGMAAIVASVVVTISEGFHSKWTITLILAVMLVILGAGNIVRWIKTKKK